MEKLQAVSHHGVIDFSIHYEETAASHHIQVSPQTPSCVFQNEGMKLSLAIHPHHDRISLRRSGCYLRLRSIKCFVFFLVEVGSEGGCCWNRWSIWVCILSDSSVTKACGRESGGGIYWAALWGITFPIMEPRVNNKNVVLTGETSVTEVINIFACGGYKLKKRIQFTHSKAIFSVISAPSLLPLFSPPDQWFFVNKSLSSCPQRLIKEQHRRTKTREVTLLIAERHFALPWKTKEKWRRRALLFFCFYAFMDTHQVCRSR